MQLYHAAQDKWLFDIENLELWETRMSASERRVLMARWMGDAVEAYNGNEQYTSTACFACSRRRPLLSLMKKPMGSATSWWRRRAGVCGATSWLLICQPPALHHGTLWPGPHARCGCTHAPNAAT